MRAILANMKQDLKILAEEIRAAKKTRKTLPNGYVPSLRNKQFEFRVKHIFRCMLRGKTLEQIENIRLRKIFDSTSTPELQIHLALSHMFLRYTKTEYAHQRIRCGCPECQKIRRGIADEQQAVCVNQN